MAKVPELKLPQVQEGALPDIRDRTNTTVDPSRIGQLSDQFQGVASKVAQEFTRAQNEANELAVQEANNDIDLFTTDLLQGQLDKPGTGALNKNGKDAIGVTLNSIDTYKKFVEDRTKDFNTNQRRLFSPSEERRFLGLRNDLSSHEQKQIEVARKNSEDASMSIADNTMQRNVFNDKKIQSELGKIIETMTKRGVREGWDKETSIAKTIERVSGSHLNIILQRADTDDVLATEHYRRYKGQMKADDILKAELHLGKVNEKSFADKASQIAFEKSRQQTVYNNKAVVEPDFDFAMKYIDENVPAGKDRMAAKAALKQKFDDWDTARVRQQSTLMREYSELLKNNPTKTFDQVLSPSMQRELEAANLQTLKRDRDKSDVDLTKFDNFMALPKNKVKEMSYKEYQEKYRSYTPEEHQGTADKHWQDSQKYVGKGPKMSEHGRIFGAVKSYMEDKGVYGVATDEGGQSQEETYLSSVNLDVQEEVAIMERATGKKLQPDEIRRIIDGVLNRKPLIEEKNLLWRALDIFDTPEKKDSNKMTGAEIRELASEWWITRATTGGLFLETNADGHGIPESRLGYVPQKLSPQDRADRKRVENMVRNLLNIRIGGNAAMEDDVVDMVWSALKYGRTDIARKLLDTVGRYEGNFVDRLVD